MRDISFEAELWEHEGDGAWHFVTLPAELGEDIRDRMPPRRGFGSVRVEAQVGDVTWRTSLFPDSTTGSFVLPMKREVRTRNDLQAGDRVAVRLTILDAPA